MAASNPEVRNGSLYEKEDVNDARNGFLLSPMDITKKVIDFKETDLPECEGLYAVVLDNCFTEAECQTLIKMAEQSSGGVWEEAMVNIGGGKQMAIKDTRDCGRIIWDDVDMVDRIWKRVVDHVPEILSLKDQPHIFGYGPMKRKETLQMSRLNERMRFLKYGEGQYFRRKSTQHPGSPYTILLTPMQLTWTAPMSLLTGKKSPSTLSTSTSTRILMAAVQRPSIPLT